MASSNNFDLIERWFAEHDFGTKRAMVLMSKLQIADPGTDKLASKIMNTCKNEVLAAAESPPEGMSKDDLIMIGVALEQDVWRQGN